jgi:hypothetical protein
MIAPIRQSDTAEASPEMRRARRHIAGSMLGDSSRSTGDNPSVPAWKAWTFATWVVVVVGVYFACMAGLL